MWARKLGVFMQKCFLFLVLLGGVGCETKKIEKERRSKVKYYHEGKLVGEWTAKGVPSNGIWTVDNRTDFVNAETGAFVRIPTHGTIVEEIK